MIYPKNRGKIRKQRNKFWKYWYKTVFVTHNVEVQATHGIMSKLSNWSQAYNHKKKKWINLLKNYPSGLLRICINYTTLPTPADMNSKVCRNVVVPAYLLSFYLLTAPYITCKVTCTYSLHVVIAPWAWKADKIHSK